jgi:nucleotide-binding universal stress UspA family protein
VGANLIGLGTSAKRGISRAVLGSFAESVALQSEIPLFIVSPETRPLSEIRDILFATDFSDSCRKAFDRLLAVAAARRAKITLFYKLEYVTPQTAGLLASYPPYRAYMEQDLQAKRKAAEDWRRSAADRGVTVEAVFDDSEAYVADAILQVAEQMNDGMIAMASQRGRAGVVLGSITRELIRRSPDPVWVIHPH